MSNYDDENNFDEDIDFTEEENDSPGFIDEDGPGEENENDYYDEEEREREEEWADENEASDQMDLDARAREDLYNDDIEQAEERRSKSFASDNDEDEDEDEDFARGLFREASAVDEEKFKAEVASYQQSPSVVMLDQDKIIDEARRPVELEDEPKAKEKIDNFIHDDSRKGMIKKYGLGFLVALWLFQFLFQGFNSILNGGEPMFNTCYDPITLTYNTISYTPMIFCAAVVVSILAVAAMGLVTLKRKGYHPTELGFKMAETNTYGSAKFAEDHEMDGALCFWKGDDPKGIVLGYNEKTKESVCVAPKRNQHVAVYGPTGTGKSFSYARPNILRCIAEKSSYVVTDPSGELFRDTAKFAHEQGMTVRVLNLKDFEASNGWQCFRDIKGKNAQTKAAAFATTTLENTKTPGTKAEKFFDDAELNLFKALILYVAVSDSFKGADYERNIGTVYDLIATLAEELSGATDPTFTDIMRNLPSGDLAKQPWQIYEGAGKIKSNIVLGLAVRLQVFQDKVVREVFTHDEIDLSLPGREPCAYYVIVEAHNNTYNFLLSLFFSSFFDALITEGEKNMSNRLDVPVNFILDEFKAIGVILGYADILANVRKYGISLSMIFQNPQQIEENYPHQSNTILSNCDTQLVLGCNDNDTARDISIRAGVATIINEGTRIDRPTMNPMPVITHESLTTGDGKRMLMNPDDVMRANDNGDVLIVCRSKNIYKAKLYGFIRHKLAPYIQDERNHTMASAYVPQWQHDGDITCDKPTYMLDYIAAAKTKKQTEDEGERQAQYKDMARKVGAVGNHRPQKRSVSQGEVDAEDRRREKELKDQMIHEGSRELDGSKLFGDKF